MSVFSERRESVRAALREAFAQAVRDGDLPAVPLPEFAVETPPQTEFGDWSTNLAMVAARPCRMAPRAIAERIVPRALGRIPDVDRLEVAGPGFINVFLHPGWLAPVVSEVLRGGAEYGRELGPRRERILVEFVSANPTGPLNVVNCRAAAFGDALVRCLRAAGYAADAEYYVNDAGGQFQRLAASLEARLVVLHGDRESPDIPEGGYPGEYLIPVAEAFVEAHGFAILERTPEERLQTLGRFAVDYLLREQKAVLERFGVFFDRFYHESEIRAAGDPERVVAALTAAGHTEEREGAIWLLSQQAGDNDDRVLRKSDGQFTYRVPDIAYHARKFDRGYDRLIDIYGQDHHGEVPAVRIALQWLGYPVERMEVLLTQMVHLIRQGQEVKVSKRGGSFVAMSDFIDEVGVDAARYFFLTRTIDTHFDFDLDLAIRQSQDNPVYYVQYAHARISGILRNAADAGDAVGSADAIGPAVLTEAAERQLLQELARYPEEVRQAAEGRAPHRLTAYCQRVAERFHVFYVQCRVLGQPAPVTTARLQLCAATAQVLRSALSLLGVTAPERM